MKKILLILGMISFLTQGFSQVSRQQSVKTAMDREFPAISNLGVEVLENDSVLLTWDFPSGDNRKMTLSWSNMEMHSSFGFAAAQCATDQAQRFDTMDLRNLEGWKIEDASLILSPSDSVFIIFHDTTFFPIGNYFVRIWKGEEADLVYEKPIESPSFGGTPITVPIESDIFIESNTELRVGYYLDQYTQFTWAYDTQTTAWVEKSTIIQVYNNFSGTGCNPNYWTTDIPYNLCISATISSPEGQGVANGVKGYRVYRDGIFVKEIPFGFITYFVDTEYTKGFDVEYCVKAVYDGGESEPICTTATITGINEESNGGITIFPNPASGLVRISGIEIAGLQVCNIMGQTVKTCRNTNEISVSNLPKGLYLLRMTNGEGAMVTKRLIVN